MIAKILLPAVSFGGVRYNTNKIDRNTGELMLVRNFGPLQAVGTLKPEDYVNYLEMITAQNKRIEKPEFHAIISCKEQSYHKNTLTAIAERWMREMGYGEQPYFIVFHKDTDHRHVHIVSTRIDKAGEKIDSGFEHVRSHRNLNRVLGYTYALKYRFSTRAQFMLLLEQKGYPGIDPPEKEIEARIAKYVTDKKRALAIRQLLEEYRGLPDFADLLKLRHHIDLVFHSSEGKRPYGYTIIDHHLRCVFKGSEVMALKELIDWKREVTEQGKQPKVSMETSVIPKSSVTIPSKDPANDLKPPKNANDSGSKTFDENAGLQKGDLDDGDSPVFATDSNVPEFIPAAHIRSIQIADDVDDQQIHGMRRRRQKKARTNTR